MNSMRTLRRKRNGRRAAYLLAFTSVLVIAVPSFAQNAQDGIETDNEAFPHLIGAMHQHSGYSDGVKGSRPADIYSSSQSLGLDFAMASDHPESFFAPFAFYDTVVEDCTGNGVRIPDCLWRDQTNHEDSLRYWDATGEQAEAATTQDFAAIRGFEWAPFRFGHIGVYFSRNYTSSFTDGGLIALETFWRWFTTSPELGGGGDALGIFNHPGAGRGTVGAGTDPGTQFNNFAYVAEADDRMVGFEVFHNWKTGNDFMADFTLALDKGWHVGAVSGEDADSHWGGPDYPKTVILAPESSRESLREAMLARRMYALHHTASDLRIDLTAAGQPMGSRLRTVDGAVVQVDAAVSPGAARLELITNGGHVAAAAEGSSLSFSAAAVRGERYYFVAVYDAFGRRVAITSPVWIRGHPLR